MIVDLVEQGRIQGVVEDGVTAFKGVPYAAPPTGGNRWAPPNPPLAWTGTRLASEFGASCPQPVFDSMEGAEPVEHMDEDCLFLNVWTPETTVNRNVNRPVMVWIHGGAFTIGEGRSLMYDGSPLAKKGAVVVTLNYRLGLLGFFTHSALEKGQVNTPINFGVLDQIAALNWVKANIASFGGNPNNVTIFGESAGAASVLSLMTSPMATGLFHKAISQSAYAIPERNRTSTRTMCEGVAKRLWNVPSSGTLHQLRDVSIEMFKLKNYPNPDGSESNERIPAVSPAIAYGDPVLPEKVRVVFEAGRQQKVPLLIGSNNFEESVALAFGMDPVEVYNAIEAIPPDPPKLGGPAILAGLKLQYANDDLEDGALDDKSRFGGLIMRDLLFTMQGSSLATWHAKQDQTVYRYFFKYVPEEQRAKLKFGATHGGEIVFAFNTGDIAPSTKDIFTDEDRTMANIFSDYWVSFAKDGKPTSASKPTPVWTAHVRKEPPTLVNMIQDRILRVDDDKIELRQGSFMIQRLQQYLESYPDFEKMIEGLLYGAGGGSK
jgi:para-nitrobenzyl esterase